MAVLSNSREGVESGIYFRNPFYSREFDLWEDGDSALLKTQSPNSLRSLIRWLINSRKKVAELIKFCHEDDNASGYVLNDIRSPIYFKRNWRSLTYYTDRFDIYSKGYHYLDERVSGHCVREDTVIYDKRLDNILKFTEYGSYKFTYEHVAKEWIKEQERLSNEY